MAGCRNCGLEMGDAEHIKEADCAFAWYKYAYDVATNLMDRAKTPGTVTPTKTGWPSANQFQSRSNQAAKTISGLRQAADNAASASATSTPTIPSAANAKPPSPTVVSPQTPKAGTAPTANPPRFRTKSDNVTRIPTPGVDEDVEDIDEQGK